jgi:hypothetical protein
MDLTTTIASALPHGMLPRHRRALAMVLAALLLVGLLAAFVQVLHGAVARGDQRWRDEAVQAEATWRCKALQGPAARMSCLAQLAVARSLP